jgi:hypothetical protein
MNGDIQFALSQRTTYVWVLLVAATCLSWWLGGRASSPTGENTQLLSTVLIVIAFIKVRFVIRYFMEVREALFALRLLTDLWCLIAGFAILALYWDIF